MQLLEIIERFAHYVQFDKDERHFDCATRKFRMHPALDRVAEINEYDPTCTLAAIYVKNAFREELAETQVSLFDVINDSSAFDFDRNMWELFNSEDVLEAERALAERVGAFVSSVTGKPLLGDASALTSGLSETIDNVVDGLHRCRFHVWMTDGAPIRKPTFFSATVHVFESAAVAVGALTSAEDGLYLSYVAQAKSTDGFFGFFLKSGGTLVSIDDLLLEEFPNQHGGFRNGRYLKAKSFNLFPYADMVKMSDPDYKGYYSKYSVNDTSYSILAFDESTYVPIALAMSCVASSLEGRVGDAGSVLFVSSMLPQNAALPDSPGAIVLRDNPQLAFYSEASSFTELDEASVVSCKTSDGIEIFKPSCKPVSEDEHFVVRDNGKRDFVLQRAAGFSLDTEPLLRVESSEFLATADTMRSVALWQARKQLAAHILKKMKMDFDAAGGIEGVQSWYRQACIAARDRIAKICAEQYFLEGHNKETWNERGCYDLHHIWHTVKGEPGVRNLHEIPKSIFQGYFFNGNGPVFLNDIAYTKRKDVRYSYLEERSEDEIMFRLHHYSGWKFMSSDDHYCTVFFLFSPYDAEDIKAMLGLDSLPRILEKWDRNEDMFGYNGNPNLDLTDPVGEISHPLCGYDFGENGKQKRCSKNSFHFEFQIGFSKRELKLLASSSES